MTRPRWRFVCTALQIIGSVGPVVHAQSSRKVECCTELGRERPSKGSLRIPGEILVHHVARGNRKRAALPSATREPEVQSIRNDCDDHQRGDDPYEILCPIALKHSADGLEVCCRWEQLQVCPSLSAARMAERSSST